MLYKCFYYYKFIITDVIVTTPLNGINCYTEKLSKSEVYIPTTHNVSQVDLLKLEGCEAFWQRVLDLWLYRFPEQVLCVVTNIRPHLLDDLIQPLRLLYVREVHLKELKIHLSQPISLLYVREVHLNEFKMHLSQPISLLYVKEVHLNEFKIYPREKSRWKCQKITRGQTVWQEAGETLLS